MQLCGYAAATERWRRPSRSVERLADAAASCQASPLNSQLQACCRSSWTECMDGTSCAREAYVRPHESLGSGGAATHPELILVHFGWSVQPPIGLRMVWRKCIEMLCAAASSLMSARTAPKPETREMVTTAPLQGPFSPCERRTVRGSRVVTAVRECRRTPARTRCPMDRNQGVVSAHRRHLQKHV